jgi:hypothetical protein
MDRRIFLAGCCGMTTATLLRAAEPDSAENQWGDLKGRFVFDGEPLEPVQFEVTKDVAIFKEPIYDESLLVNKANRGLANVVVTLRTGKPGELPPIHPSYQTDKLPAVEMTFRGAAIRPRVTVLRTGQEYICVNADAVGHVPRIDLRRNPPLSVLLSRDRETISKGYRTAEDIPVSIHCSVHPWESALLVVTDHPYVAVSQADGSFVIENLPVGQWTFRLWHERCGWIKQATVAGKPQKLERGGKLTVEIKPGANDLGEIKIEPKLLERKR